MSRRSQLNRLCESPASGWTPKLRSRGRREGPRDNFGRRRLWGRIQKRVLTSCLQVRSAPSAARAALRTTRPRRSRRRGGAEARPRGGGRCAGCSPASCSPVELGWPCSCLPRRGCDGVWSVRTWRGVRRRRGDRGWAEDVQKSGPARGGQDF